MSVSPPSAPIPFGPTPTHTAASALGVTGGASVLLWIIACINAGQLLTPDTSTAMVMAAAAAPLLHALYNALLARVNRLGGTATSVTFDPPKPGASS